MHEELVDCLFKLAQEKVWLGELIVTIAVDLGGKATKQTNIISVKTFIKFKTVITFNQVANTLNSINYKSLIAFFVTNCLIFIFGLVCYNTIQNLYM